jgi:hypothetical protein
MNISTRPVVTAALLAASVFTAAAPAEAGIGDLLVALDLNRAGSRSTFGEVRVLKAGVKDPIALQKAVAVYTEIGSRRVSIPLSPDFKGDVNGPVTVQYIETADDGANVIAETKTVLR